MIYKPRVRIDARMQWRIYKDKDIGGVVISLAYYDCFRRGAVEGLNAKYFIRCANIRPRLQCPTKNE